MVLMVLMVMLVMLMLMFMCCDGYDGILENSLDNVGSLQRSEGKATRQDVSRSVLE